MFFLASRFGRLLFGILVERRGRVLVVDDLDSNREVLADIVQSGGHEALTAATGAEAIDVAVREQPDVILLDVQMPGMDGFETCRRLKDLAETGTIPVVFVTAHFTGENDQVHGLELGGYDYLVKPISRAVVLARIEVMLRIRRTEERIRQLSMIDEFTGLYSRKYVLHRLDEEMKRAERGKTPLVVSMIDLDDFKRCNDTYGHQFGDRVLKGIASVLQSSVRSYDSIGRYGGEEFLLVQPEVGEREAMISIDRLQDRVRSQTFECEGSVVRMTFSAGLAVWDFRARAEELIGRADKALYAAKAAGKGQVARFSDGASVTPLKRRSG